MRAKLFVGNLNYETSVEHLAAVFQPFQGYLHTKICYERHTGKPLGYAVVHFDNPAAAQYAIDMLHNVKVDGRHIVVAPYRPRVTNASASGAAPGPPSAPAANEAVALVMDLNKNATWMDLKDILSQRSKVLFVEEPRTLRAAFVHFASEADLEQAQATFRNTSVLGSEVDVVPRYHLRAPTLQIGMDSVLMSSDQDDGRRPPQQRPHEVMGHGPQRSQHGLPPLSPQPMVPVTYVSQGGPPIGAPYMHMDQPYQGLRPAMWQGQAMPQFTPEFTVPTMPMSGHMAAAQASTGGFMPPTGMQMQPHPVGMGGGSPAQPSASHAGGSDVEGTGGMQQYPVTSGQFATSQAAVMPPAAALAAGAQHSTTSEGLSSSGSANLSPDLHNLVRQLAMHQLGGHQNMPAPDDR